MAFPLMFALFLLDLSTSMHKLKKEDHKSNKRTSHLRRLWHCVDRRDYLPLKGDNAPCKQSIDRRIVFSNDANVKSFRGRLL